MTDHHVEVDGTQTGDKPTKPTPLLATKLYIPQLRPNIVSRPRLLAQLNAGLGQGPVFGQKLTLISAPAGFGKTTLLSEWIHQLKDAGGKMKNEDLSIHPSRVAWLALDQDDNDPVRFWRYVVAALQTIDPTIGQIAQAALQTPEQPPLDTLVTTLLNDLTTLPVPLVLILDDYHVIDSEAIHRCVNLLLDHAPPPFHLVITTRADPPLALARRRARAELVEIRTADLCFTRPEATKFLNTWLGLALSAEDITALEKRTEGWIAGLQMAALSLQNLPPTAQHNFVTAFAGDDRYIIDYLIEEVLQHQPPHLQTFLQQTSILTRLCGPLCAAVTGINDSQAMLDHLEHSNLFIQPLDNRRHWYRYHQLFADLLRQHLGQTQTAPEIAQLHRRASAWYEHEGDIAEAVAHAFQSSDFEYAAELIERHVLTTFYRSEIMLVHNWLKNLPQDVICKHSLLCAVYANAIVLVSSYAPDSLELAEQWLQTAENTLADPLAAEGQPPSAMVAGFIATFRAFLARFRGDDPQTVIDLSLQALACLPANSLRFRSALAFNLATAHLILGQEDAAYQAFAEARRIGQASNDLYNALTATYLQTKILHNHQRLPDIAEICQQTLEEIVKPAEQAGRPLPVAGAIYVALGRVLFEWKQLAEAEGTLIQGLKLLQMTSGLGLIMRDGYLTLAQVKQAQGNTAQALELIAQAETASPQQKTQGLSATQLNQIMAEFKPPATSPTTVLASAPQFQLSLLAESLTPRELEVLQLIAAGATNAEIAQELVITVNTVKKHITNIFGKLGVTTRTQAVASARKLGLVR